MTAWDLSLDPGASTINQVWIWENGGGFFGVPLGNFVGWTFTVYLFMQVFALYLRRRGPHTTLAPAQATASDLQGVLLYAATTMWFFTRFFTGERTTVTDATGMTWRTWDIYETSVLVTIYGMIFIAALALLRTEQRISPPALPAQGTVTRQAEPDPARPSALRPAPVRVARVRGGRNPRTASGFLLFDSQSASVNLSARRGPCRLGRGPCRDEFRPGRGSLLMS
jgi:Carotenoid biosynthesis protein